MDKNGAPRVVYHGSPDQFESFDDAYLGANKGHAAGGWGHFFSSSRATAGAYGEHVGEYFLRIRKPYTIKANSVEHNDLIKQSLTVEAARRIALKLAVKGYDGIIIDATGPLGGGFTYIVLSSRLNNIKSLDNDGTFEESPYLRFSEDIEVPPEVTETMSGMGKALHNTWANVDANNRWKQMAPHLLGLTR